MIDVNYGFLDEIEEFQYFKKISPAHCLEMIESHLWLKELLDGSTDYKPTFMLFGPLTELFNECASLRNEVGWYYWLGKDLRVWFIESGGIVVYDVSGGFQKFNSRDDAEVYILKCLLK